MDQSIITIGATFGALAVIFGAFGAHALKKIMNEEQLKNYETGVKYQMYHAIVLLIIGFNSDSVPVYQNIMVNSFIIGIILFSFSIYGLSISAALNKKISLLGPVTPIGGLLLVLGWILLIWNFL
ncbi:DUF423 domain-containing protein [Myroides ceti]|uniref:DUF423 domain-containing protein n=1 Tax=Paenimyroides ceti TaxID=395087 RepID=A0ABT8CQX0_9FLAO|nr:DUF423 domain-containing protein [Paenimyroides ceti]MDN3706909.1 DUF423 domain-containing protein [Paenimyroides ceti]